MNSNPAYKIPGPDDFENECRAMFNDICIVHDSDLGRLIGYNEDKYDSYYIIRTKPDAKWSRLQADGTWQYYATMSGACETLREVKRYDRIESDFTFQGCPPAAEFINTREKS